MACLLFLVRPEEVNFSVFYRKRKEEKNGKMASKVSFVCQNIQRTSLFAFFFFSSSVLNFHCLEIFFLLPVESSQNILMKKIHSAFKIAERFPCVRTYSNAHSKQTNNKLEFDVHQTRKQKSPLECPFLF